jgi:DNA-binding CsgD family transcriptional regulator
MQGSFGNTTHQMRIRKITPRTIQIMERVMLGERSGQIARSLGVTQSRISTIINSPLFKMEMRRRMLKHQEKLSELRDTLLDGAIDSLKLHREVAGDKTDGVKYPLETRLKSATVMASFGLKILERTGFIPQPTPQSQEGGGGSYEERLKEVIFRETTRTSSNARALPLPDEDDELSPEKMIDSFKVEEPETIPEISEELAKTYPPEDLITADNEFVEEEFEKALLKEARS